MWSAGYIAIVSTSISDKNTVSLRFSDRDPSQTNLIPGELPSELESNGKTNIVW